jgi:hypothetical protein
VARGSLRSVVCGDARRSDRRADQHVDFVVGRKASRIGGGGRRITDIVELDDLDLGAADFLRIKRQRIALRNTERGALPGRRNADTELDLLVLGPRPGGRDQDGEAVIFRVGLPRDTPTGAKANAIALAFMLDNYYTVLPNKRTLGKRNASASACRHITSARPSLRRAAVSGPLPQRD